MCGLCEFSHIYFREGTPNSGGQIIEGRESRTILFDIEKALKDRKDGHAIVIVASTWDQIKECFKNHK